MYTVGILLGAFFVAVQFHVKCSPVHSAQVIVERSHPPHAVTHRVPSGGCSRGHRPTVYVHSDAKSRETCKPNRTAWSILKGA